MNRRVLIVSGICLVVALWIGSAYYYYFDTIPSKDQLNLTPVAASYRHIISEVEISGLSAAEDAVDLAFRNSGVIDSVPVKTGSIVRANTMLASVRSGVLAEQLLQARANLDSQLSKLADLKNESVYGISGPEVSSTALASTRNALLATLASAQSTADIVIRFTIGQFISNPESSNSISLLVSSTDARTTKFVLEERKKIQPLLVSWNSRLGSLQTATTDAVLSASDDMISYLQTIGGILDGLTQVLASSDDLSRSLPGQASIAAARSQITASQIALTTARQQVPTSAAVSAQNSIVESMRAKVSEIEEELRDRRLVAPFDGIITDVYAKQGEMAITGALAVSMISNGPLKVEGYVPEIYYGGIQVGQPVRIKIDAFPTESFAGELTLINPIATMRDGVPSFKVTVKFKELDPRIRPGLTATAYVQTADRPLVLTIPIAAVTGSGESATVLRLIDSVPTPTPVKLGAVGVDGFVEVLSGLVEKDVVLVNTTKQYKIVPN